MAVLRPPTGFPREKIRRGDVRVLARSRGSACQWPQIRDNRHFEAQMLPVNQPAPSGNSKTTYGNGRKIKYQLRSAVKSS